MPKVLNFGSLNMDHVYTMEHFVRPGETTSAKKLELFCGGKGLNQSVALARAGADVYHAGAVGEQDGTALLDTLKHARVHTEFVRQLPIESGHAIIQVDADGQNCIIMYGGANRAITREDITATLSHFSPGDYLVLQNEVSCVGEMITLAHEKGLKIAFNPSPICENIRELPLELCDYLIVNEVEGQALCRDVAVPELLNALTARFPHSAILLTLGAEGAQFCAPCMQTAIFQKAYHRPVKDTTAAGDTFMGYFIALIAEGAQPALALRFAAVAAGIAVSRNGAEASIPYWAEVEEAAKAWS